MTEIEFTSRNVNVIEDLVYCHEEYESDHDSSLLSIKAFISNESQ